jgi:carbonic anhydrase
MVRTATPPTALPHERSSAAVSDQHVRSGAWFASGARRPYDPTAKTMLERATGNAESALAGTIETVLERNRAFAASGGHQGAVVFPKLRMLVITCLDPRVDPAHFLGLDLSDAMVVRNVGGRVTPEVINDVAFVGQIAENVLPDGPLFEVAVVHHTQCGAGALADDAFRRDYARRVGADESELVDHAVLDPTATVTSDVQRLRSAPAIPSRVTVSGHVYDVVTGLVQTILPG